MAHNSGAVLNLGYKPQTPGKQRLTDSDVKAAIQREVKDAKGEGELKYEEVDFSGNELTSRGILAVLDICRRCPKLRILKLFKNDIDDHGADGLADLCRTSQTIEEIHLSHNKFTAVGVEKIVTAAESERPQWLPPLWLRMEQNYVEEHEALLEKLLKLNVCDRRDERKCSNKYCAWKCKVHVPYLYLQRQPSKPYQSASGPARTAPGGKGMSMNGDAGPSRRATAPAQATSAQPKWGNPIAGPSPVPAGVASAGHNGYQRTGLDYEERWSRDEAARPSLVLDEQGYRRIDPKQLEGEASCKEFMCCVLCGYVLLRPIATNCEGGPHLFCEACFKGWVTEQVTKQKQSGLADGPVPVIPCPHPNCGAELRKKDMMLMSHMEYSNPAATLYHRKRGNLRIRCVHHSDLSKFAFGSDSQRATRETGIMCTWVGDYQSYEEHIRKSCLVESYLASNSTGATAGATGTAAAGTNMGAMGNMGSPTGGAGSEHRMAQGNSPTGRADQAASFGQGGAEEQVRCVKFDYEPTDKAQIILRAGDLVKVYKITPTGWAAGVKICPHNKTELGDAGWFPEGYLHPKDYQE